MKKILLSLCLLWGSTALAYAQKTVNVSTAEELLEAFAPNVIIQLQAGKYDLSLLAETMAKGEYYSYEPVYDGLELVVKDINNLTIKGKGAEIVTQPAYGNVFVFKNCNNIILEDFTAGHSPEKGGCVGGVLKFIDVPNVSINNCNLYGSGIEGITAENVANLACKNVDIYECTYGLMTLTNVGKASFEKCTFRDSEQYDLINITNGGKIVFKNCKITNNKTGDAMNYALFNVQNTASVVVESCTIENNTVQVFAKDAKSVTLKNTTLNKNRINKK